MLVSCPSLHHNIKSHGAKETQKALIKFWLLFLCSFILNHKISSQLGNVWCQHSQALALSAHSDPSGNRTLGLWALMETLTPQDSTITVSGFPTFINLTSPKMFWNQPVEDLTVNQSSSVFCSSGDSQCEQLEDEDPRTWWSLSSLFYLDAERQPSWPVHQWLPTEKRTKKPPKKPGSITKGCVHGTSVDKKCIICPSTDQLETFLWLRMSPPQEVGPA